MKTFPYRRIAVVGTTGSGKSTLAEALAHRLHIPHVELDALFWQPDWIESDWDEMRERVEELTRGPAWVTDGNYSFCRDLIWGRAEAVIWLDYPLPLILWWLWRRTWARALRRELLWGTNYERLWSQFFSRDSIFLWALKTYRRRKEQYTRLAIQPENSHLKVFHFKSPRETRAWLESLSDSKGVRMNY